MAHWNDPEDRPEDVYDEELESLLDSVAAMTDGRTDAAAQLTGAVPPGDQEEGW